MIKLGFLKTLPRINFPVLLFLLILLNGFLFLSLRHCQPFQQHFLTPNDTVGIYSPIAINILEGKGVTHQGQVYTGHPPLYSLFLAGFYFLTGKRGTGNDVYPYLVVLFQSLSCGILYLVARRFLSNRLAAVGAFLYASYPFFLVLTVTRYAWHSGPFFIFLSFAGLEFFFKACDQKKISLFFWSGVLLSLAALTSAILAYVWVIFLMHPFSFGEPFRFKRIFCSAKGLFFVGFIIPLMIWSSYIYQSAGQKVFVASEVMPAISDGLVHREGSKVRSFAFSQRAFKALQERSIVTIADVGFFYLNELSVRPKEVLSFFAFKIFRPWYGMDSERFEKWVASIQIVYLILSFFGARLLWGKHPGEVKLLLMWVGYFWFIAFCALPILRYMIPCMGLLMIFVAAALGRIAQGVKSLLFKKSEQEVVAMPSNEGI